MNNTPLPEFADVQAAAKTLDTLVHRTPVMTSSRLDARIGAELHFKCENLQRTGSFKIRGATNAVQRLNSTEASHGVATHSSGNHGAALCVAAADRGIAAHVVVPQGAVPSKLAAIRGYGGRVIECEPNQRAREQGLADVLAATGAVAIPPYDHRDIIAGQGTAALELIDQVDGLDVIIAPVGGGGLISGTLLAAAGIRVIGAEPLAADDAARSLARGDIVEDHRPETMADGLRARIGELNFKIMNDHKLEIVTVSEEEIAAAMVDIWHTLKLVIEPSSATVWAAVLQMSDLLAGKRVGLILSGGNADLGSLINLEKLK